MQTELDQSWGNRIMKSVQMAVAAAKSPADVTDGSPPTPSVESSDDVEKQDDDDMIHISRQERFIGLDALGLRPQPPAAAEISRRGCR